MKKLKVLYLILLIPLALSLLILVLPKFLPTKLPLFYSLPWGETQLATPKQFLIIPAIILLLSLINISIARSLHPQQVLLKKIISLSTILISIILVITIIKIIFIFI